MMDLLWNAITHIPGHIIRDRTRIGNDNDSFQYVLALEGWELRVYQYEFLDEILEEAYNTENFREACDYFYDFFWYLNINTLSYTRLDLGWEREKTRDELIDYVKEYLAETPRDLEERIVKFFRDNIERLGAKVYQYYK
jgi:hypothetical protein